VLADQDKFAWCETACNTETVAGAELAALSTLCAVTITDPLGTEEGAVYTPAVDMEPVDTVPPTTPLTSQYTPVLLVPETVAVNCCD